MILVSAQPARELGELLQGVVAPDASSASAMITNLTLDSRTVSSGSLFFGLPGEKTDGRRYVDQALCSGAAAVLVEGRGWDAKRPIEHCYPIDGLREQIGRIASRFFGSPSHALCVVGVTGTNGKTTCASLLAQALTLLGRRSGLIGTTGWGLDGDMHPSELTTPDALTLQSRLAELVAQGAESVCLEVSSHAIDQGRIEGIHFNSALFTNLSRDHLDYHHTMEGYAETKLLLFRRQELESAIINVTDPVGRAFAREDLSARLWTYGEDDSADIFPTKIDIDTAGTALCLASPIGEISFTSALRGHFNVSNLSAVAAMLVAYGYSAAKISEVMSRLEPVPGRMLFCRGSGGGRPTVVIDYAHSPEALSKLLTSLRAYTEGELWCVFGCGGERDRGKRAAMGREASQLADRIVITNDNPRSEDPDGILSDIAEGMSVPAEARIPQRGLAIAYAIAHALPRDLVVVAGKGHETRQIVGDQTIPFSDQAIAEEILRKMPCST
ncbi:MAG TPA: UDP-N-acetylmuramoyl-L-alanyl-D-glutamate--2,6-diaminopimelate ligase [Gammaproteobacteria bacterium]|jgi:UDP-N-acetylmuramoyl-L-alanyl-D-glutamate--2,6-diaminopimelate ligase|nr:UDP-N-acetylmuramoyl-L-alanyl-D-glutamate--2,6-diaminopimelate ligase [Acidiferrobacteraceae bacterium]MDP6397387.1 UDP-N-acetylmuramoyl-L-alanyl-D-glutamate--2,6-diaminopimelate ligase [Arenicellales bacterium]HCX87793.1 UDP-N-acetylmuramoyl-L-alanyl-D-glutamate--2,6-diaminopimelate ligase [Gammaproteobacteria bacterium]MDP6551741.1 UDP-N-acetylmuramoyl-L-alanyl-D-glutamate--2,6-diaminopimelate ligase [Arenicellales bacterium]MDP6791469.1 UDP-N-acetylmuramoyl-L-alanyl-D-glutamate--2,6-diami|tara:strand:+ start:137 stop:1633 length:1497 start_codon:yes stop_codon:yes gene_type:complete